MNNRQFAKEQAFTTYCEWAKIPPTKRQASKFRAGRGRAFRAKKLGPPKVEETT